MRRSRQPKGIRRSRGSRGDEVGERADGGDAAKGVGLGLEAEVALDEEREVGQRQAVEAEVGARLRLLAACLLTMALVSLVGVWVCAYIEAAAVTATLSGAA